MVGVGPHATTPYRARRNPNPGGCLIGDTVDPTSEDAADLAYEERNRRAGFHRGHVRLRLHFGTVATPWWELLTIPNFRRRAVDRVDAGP